MKTRLTLIAAMDANRLLADSRGIPWRLPRDTEHFRACTRGKWLLLGRRTFVEMRRWFDAGHTPLVLSSQCGWEPDIGRVVASVPQALALAGAAGQAELICCGGGQTYAAALPYADRMVLSLVAHEFTPDRGAVHFPNWDPAEWNVVAETGHPADRANPHDLRIVELTRAT